MHSKPLLCAGLVSFVASLAPTLQHASVLLQQRAEESSRAKVPLRSTADDVGKTVPVTEKGYNYVASLGSDEEMKAFIHRVLEHEARYVKSEDVAYLNGLVPFFSGTKSTQDLMRLKQELRRVPWVSDGEGRTAPLTETGYQKVASMKSKAHMSAFARRIIDLVDAKEKKNSIAEDKLSGLIPYYDGEKAVQSFDQLKTDLLNLASPPGATEVALKEHPEEEPVETTLATTQKVGEEKEELDDLKVAFDSFDVDKSSRLSAAELKQALNSFGKELSDDARSLTVEEMLIEADADGNGEIDVEEFRAKMKD